MDTPMVVVIVVINLAISWYNAKVCGGCWAETKALGGFPRLLAWCGAVQSAVGFSMVLMGAGLVTAHAFAIVPAKVINGAVSLWYLAVIIPVIGTGIIITIESLVTAWRERNLVNIGRAAWNTYASVSNIHDAAGGAVSSSLDSVSEMFDSDDSASTVAAKLALVMVGIALLGGAMLTYWLIRHYARHARFSNLELRG